jgi:hypothetical protein
MTAAVPTIAKRQWFNWLIGSPVGYLPAMGPAEEVRVELRPLRYLAWGPAWLGHWMSVFLLALVPVSLVVHRLVRAQ